MPLSRAVGLLVAVVLIYRLLFCWVCLRARCLLFQPSLDSPLVSVFLNSWAVYLPVYPFKRTALFALVNFVKLVRILVL